jgi:hypothetical protein
MVPSWRWRAVDITGYFLGRRWSVDPALRTELIHSVMLDEM